MASDLTLFEEPWDLVLAGWAIATPETILAIAQSSHTHTKIQNPKSLRNASIA
ncbi:MAG: hypothetical protein AAGD25_20975 [Cyanobacteria bacterium P01_F01_bin.150]